MIPHSRPSLGAAERAAVLKVLASGKIAQGPLTARAETALARLVGLRRAAAVNSGTTALEFALRGLGVRPGREVLVPSFACAAVAQAVVAAGAKPVAVDVDPRSLLMDPGHARRRTTRRTEAVVLVHSFGLLDDPAPYRALGLKVVEDCCGALGAPRAGRLGDAAVFSAYATKLVAAGEGGFVVGRAKGPVDYARAARSCDDLPLDLARRNVKWTDLQAALFLAQLKRLPGFLRQRREIAREYLAALEGSGIGLPDDDPTRVWQRFIVRGRRAAGAAVARFELKGVAARRPVPRPLHWDLGPRRGFPGAEEAWRFCLSLPLYPGLTRAERSRVARAAIAILG